MSTIYTHTHTHTHILTRFRFSAFDEPWKPASVGDNGKAADETAWGAMTADRKTKFSLKC